MGGDIVVIRRGSVGMHIRVFIRIGINVVTGDIPTPVVSAATAGCRLVSASRRVGWRVVCGAFLVVAIHNYVIGKGDG